MLQGYLDESYRDTPDTAPVYVVAGYLADVASWVEFETRWSESMRRLKIDTVGLHAADCERGVKKFAGMDERERRQIVLQMVTDINASGLCGVIVAIDNAALRKHGENESFWAKPAKKYHRQHIYAMDM